MRAASERATVLEVWKNGPAGPWLPLDASPRGKDSTVGVFVLEFSRCYFNVIAAPVMIGESDDVYSPVTTEWTTRLYTCTCVHDIVFSP